MTPEAGERLGWRFRLNDDPLVPLGMVRTAAYMRAVFERHTELLWVPRDIDASTAARLERRQPLYCPLPVLLPDSYRSFVD